MLKSGLKLSAAALIGGMLSLSFLYFFPINENHNTTAVTSSKEITEKEKENEIQAVNAIPNVNYEKANLDFTSAAEKTVNSVVHIQSTYLTQQSRDPIFEFFYGPQPNQQNQQIATGSGVIISKYIYYFVSASIFSPASIASSIVPFKLKAASGI